MEEQLRVGVEVHVRLKTDQKLFSNSLNLDSLSQANKAVSAYDCALPGSKPTLDKDSYLKALVASLLLRCVPTQYITFDRKHYLYVDLPHGYQLTQRYNPVARRGFFQGVRIKQVHLEMDAAKTIRHANAWEVNYNRAGVPLIEVVTQPDITSSSNLSQFLTQLREKMVSYGVSNCNMYRGDMRFDINVSGSNRVRQEVKNLNSFKFAEKALRFMLNHDLLRLKNSYTWEWRDEQSKLVKLREKISYFYLPEFDLEKRYLTSQDCRKVNQYLANRNGLIKLVNNITKEAWLREELLQRKWDYWTEGQVIKVANLLQGSRVRSLSKKEIKELLSLDKLANFNKVRDYLLTGKQLVNKSVKDILYLEEDLKAFSEDFQKMLSGNVGIKKHLIGQMVKLGYDPKQVSLKLDSLILGVKNEVKR